MVKVWNLTNCKLKKNHYGHSGYLNTVTVSPDGSLCASGGKVSYYDREYQPFFRLVTYDNMLQDCKAMLWDLNDDKQLHTLEHNDIITALCFSPNRYWLCAAYGPSVKIWVCITSLDYSVVLYLINETFFIRIWRVKRWLKN